MKMAAADFEYKGDAEKTEANRLRRLLHRRRHRLPHRGRLPVPVRPQGRHDHLRRRQHLPGRDRERDHASPEGRPTSRCSASRTTSGASRSRPWSSPPRASSARPGAGRGDPRLAGRPAGPDEVAQDDRLHRARCRANPTASSSSAGSATRTGPATRARSEDRDADDYEPTQTAPKAAPPTGTRCTSLEFPGGYTRSVGPVIGRFLTELRDGRLVGVRTPAGRVLFPPAEYDAGRRGGAPRSSSRSARRDRRHATPGCAPPPGPSARPAVRVGAGQARRRGHRDAARRGRSADLETGARSTPMALRAGGAVTDLAVRARGDRDDRRDIEAFRPDVTGDQRRRHGLEYRLQRRARRSTASSRHRRGADPRPPVRGVRQGLRPDKGACPMDGVAHRPRRWSCRTPARSRRSRSTTSPTRARPTCRSSSAYVLLDGADIAMFAWSRACPADEVRMGMRVRAVWVPTRGADADHDEHQVVRADRRARRPVRRYQGVPVMRDVAVVGVRADASTRVRTGLDRGRDPAPVIHEVQGATGLTRRFGFTCSGSLRLPGRRAVLVRLGARRGRRVAADLREPRRDGRAPGRCTKRGCGCSTATSTPRWSTGSARRTVAATAVGIS